MDLFAMIMSSFLEKPDWTQAPVATIQKFQKIGSSEVACQGWYKADQSIFYLNFLTMMVGTRACISEFKVVLWGRRVKKYVK